MKRVYLALPASDAMEAAIRKRLKRKKLAKQLEIVDELESAQVVVTSSDDIGTLPECLPASVELLQLIDCGGGQRYRDAPNLTITNAFDLYEVEIMMFASEVVHELSELRHAFGAESLQLGLVGLGRLGVSLLKMLAESTDRHHDDSSDPMNFQPGSVVVNDIRTPPQGAMTALQKLFGASDISVRRMSLDQLLSTSDVVVVAVYHGPTADPLLGDREARLLDSRAWVVDVSENGVVDPSAFVSLKQYVSRLMDGEDSIDPDEPGASDRLRAGPVYVRVEDAVREKLAIFGIDTERDPKDIAKFVGWNLRRFSRGKSINEVEHVDFPSAGDPAFWSSRMSPRE